MKYMIAKAETSDALVKRVNWLMKEGGWEPLGAHAVMAWKEVKGVKIAFCFEYSQVLINQSE